MQISQLLLLPRDSPCVECNTAPPPCACQAGYQCVQTVQTCSACSTFTCIAPSSSSSSGSGVSAGAVAGAVVGVLLFVGICTGAFFLWRRRQLAKIAAERAKAAAEPKDVPAPAETVLRRPDPSEKPAPPSPRLLALAQAAQAQSQSQSQNNNQHLPSNVRVYDNETSVIDLDPQGEAHGGQSRQSQNPFGDGQSILTTSTGSQQTNVIPIALVPPGTVSPVHASSSSSSSSAAQRSSVSTGASSLAPPRALGGGGGGVNMDHLNVSRDSSIIAGGGPGSGGASPRRASGGSYVTNASYASDLDAVIVTSSSRHVLGVGHAAAITTPLASASLSANGRTPGRSPLSATAFAAADAHHDDEDIADQDPFGDDAHTARSSLATFATSALSHHSPPPSPQHHQHQHYPPDVAGRAMMAAATRERPLSSVTQAASVIGAEVVGASRVQLNYTTPTHTPLSPAFSTASSSYPSSSASNNAGAGAGVKRMTSARLVVPPQLHARAQRDVQAARAQQALERRPSLSTVASGVSTTVGSGGRADADSILEAFPFVPPSPIAGRPPRSPTTPTTTTQARSPTTPTYQTQMHMQPQPPPSPSYRSDRAASPAGSSQRTDGALPTPPDSPLPPPPNRRALLGMSTASEMSNVSTGLGSFPFEIDAGSSTGHAIAHGNTDGHGHESGSVGGKRPTRVRASLDTLALTSDLASYPLGFDRGELDVPPTPRK